MSTKGTVFVGLSGGVDSAVSAALLKQQGYAVTGIFIRIALPGYPCQAGTDKIEAMRVAAHLHIPFQEIDLSSEYAKRVFDPSIKEFSKGHTPNPDVLCNREIKFDAFFEFARAHGADFIATGHYARITKNKEGRARLLAGVDASKDQSYFLWATPESVLQQTLFPVGGLQKQEVRRLAQQFGLPNAARKDSQGLCFLGDISIEDMLARETHLSPGDVLSEDGDVIGSHGGALSYTLGQRHGFTLFKQRDGVAHFVIAKDIEKNTITVSTNRFPTHASKTKIELANVNWIGKTPPKTCSARYRYRQALIAAEVSVSENASTITLLEPQYVPEGQSLVLYDGEECFGGGVIVSAMLY